MKKKIAFFLLLLLFPALITGCRSAQKKDATFFAMDTFFTLSVYGEESVLQEAEEMVREMEKLFSVTDPDSPVSVLNATGAAEENEELAVLVFRCKEIGSLTEGTFDITVYPAVRAWGFTTDAHKVLTKEESDALLPLIGYDKIAVNGNVVSLAEGSQIDLGGVAKGYCSDKLVAFFRSRNVTSGILSLGGNVYALGAKPDGTKWKVAVQDPDGDGYVGRMEATDQAVVTSGIYERFFEEDGIKYGHIIDPFTARSVECDLLSVTVVGESGLLCDALSTALFVMGKEKAVSFLQNAGVDAILVTKDKEVLLTPGLQGNFTAEGVYADKTQVISW